MNKYVLGVLFLCFLSCANASLINVAASENGGVATAISVGSYSGTTQYASHVNDSDYGTDWCSQWSMPAWVQVEFDDIYEISKVAVQVNYHQQTFAASLSNDGINWTEVVSPTLSGNIPSQLPTSESAGISYEMFDITPQNAKFMRVNITTTTAPSSHIFQSIVSEMEAYTVPEPATLSLLLLGGLALRKRKA